MLSVRGVDCSAPMLPERPPGSPCRWEMELPGSCAREPSHAGAQLQAATLLSRNLFPPLAWSQVDTPSIFVFSATSVRGHGEGPRFQGALRA